MQKSKNGIFKKVLSSVLSAACVLSTAAFVGTASATSVDAATYTKPAEGSPATFSWDNASVYFLLTDRFNNGDPSNDHSYGRGLDQDGNVVSYDNYAAFQGGDFKGITDKINEGYFNDLGVNAIWLSAPYEQIHGYCVGCNGESFAHYSYHGYYVLDYTESDKNFGTKEEFKELVDTAHEHGIRIVMDIVMNHSGYNTLKDQAEYGFGSVKSGWESYYYSHQNVNNTDYHSYIDYESSADLWAKWWGPDWIRCGLPGYTVGGGDIEGSLAGLPDFKTGSSTQVGIPEVLKTKWTKEGTYNEKVAKYGSSNTVTGYLSDWLAEWVREFGVDGFRCDTAKHVELSAWKILKDKCVKALREWKAENPTKKLDDLDFWMTGECFGHQVGKSSYYTDGGFDSMINFEFAPAVNSSNIPSAGAVDALYNRYASSINSDKSFNALSYLASHDTTLAKGDRKYAGSFLLMLPGGIQIYYGDETNRPMVNSPFANVDPGAGHQFRGFMNWDSVDTDILSHWQKVGQFRNNHIAVGAGQHKAISGYSSSTGYTFSRTYNDGTIQDTIVATLFAAANTDITVDVSSVWSDGVEITNFYDGSTCKVSGGKVTFNSGANGTILMQEPQGAKGKVTVKHINKTTGETIKTETMMGLIDDSYATSPLASLTDYYTVSSVTGPTTGTYSETEKTVTYYYVFDSANNGIIKIKYVDDSTGVEIADSDESYGKIGSTYSVSPKAIKNYEVNESKTTNASGTVKSGTTTVVFRYNYVEPTNVQIHYYNANNWSSVAMYVYDETSGVVEYTGKWPGKAMTNEGNGWFYGEVEAETATFIANNNGGGKQEPASGAPGYSVTGEVWIKNGKVYPTGKVNVKYVNSTGKVIATEIVKGMADGSNQYTTSAKTFDGYTLQSTPSNATGVFSETPVTVTYVYKASETPVTPLANNSTLSKTTINYGDALTITGKATGGTSPYKYTFLCKHSTASSWTTLTSYGTTTTRVWQPTKSGTYSVRTKVKDSTGKEVVKDFTLTVNSSSLTNSSTLSKTTISYGNSITITGKASGGTSPYKYSFLCKHSSSTSWTTLTSYGTTSTRVWKPTKSGTYSVRTKVKDSTGKEVVKDFTLTVNSSSFTNSSTLSKTTISYGNSITITGKATGGTAPYKYSFLCKHSSSSSWSTLTSYGTTSTRVWKPTKSGTYTVRTKVKDSTGTEVIKDFTLTVNSSVSLANNSTISETSINYGDAITITGKATGGTAPYKYSFLCKHSSSSSWSTLTSYGTTSTRVWKPTKKGTYIVRTKIKDATGIELVRDFALEVN